jgi:hypothetical protein
MASRNLDTRPVHGRLLILVLGEAVVGTLLFAFFTVMPLAVQLLFGLVAWAIGAIGVFDSLKKKSVGSLLRRVTAACAFLCLVGWIITCEDIWWRLVLVHSCLMAALRFIDDREDWVD